MTGEMWPRLRGSGSVRKAVAAMLAIAFAASLALLPHASAQAPYARDLPQPGGWVNDFAGAFDDSSRQKLFQLCVELESKTTAELTVVTIRSLHGEPIESYATRLFNYWGVGKRDANNGVMLLFSMRDRRMRIAVGDGLTSVLPDPLCQRILDDTIAPFFGAGRYGDGAYAGAAGVAQTIAAHYGQTLHALATDRPPRVSLWIRVLGAVRRLFRAIGSHTASWWWPAFVLVYIILRLLFGNTEWWEFMDDSIGDGGWTSGWGGGGGGFGGGSTSGGGASGSW